MHRLQNLTNIVLNGGGIPGTRPEKLHRFFRRFITTVVVLALASVILGSFQVFAPWRRHVFMAVSYFSALLFTLEYLLRLWSAPAYYHHLRKPWLSRLRYAVSFLGIVDLFAILPFVLPLFFPHDASFVSLIEFARILLIFKLSRYSAAMRLMESVFRSVRSELWLGVMLAATVVVFSGMLMYYVERDAQPEAFNNVGQGFWWSVITFSTVGYGDIYPVTPVGKVLASFIAFIGIGMIALPTGILSSAFMKKMSELRTGRHWPPEKKSRKGPPSGSGDGRGRYCPHCGRRLDE